MKKYLVFAFFIIASTVHTLAVDRHVALMTGKKLVVQTTSGQTYHYLISQLGDLVMHLPDHRVVIEKDTFLISEIKSMRFSKMQHFLLDEDSTSFAGNYAVDKGLLGLHRTLHLNTWNSLTVPVDMNGQQVRETFGEDARLAIVSHLRSGDNTSVEFSSIDLDKANPAIEAGKHYILWPTREPDIKEGEEAPYSWTATHVAGPLYITPLVSLPSKQTKPSPENLFNDNRTQHVFINGTYARLDDTYKVGVIIKNKRLAPGAYTFNEDGYVIQNKDSVIVPAFRSWFQDYSEPSTPLHFYIDGIDEDLAAPTGIVGILSDLSKANEEIYDLNGRCVAHGNQTGSLCKGIYIVRSPKNKKGKKIIIK